MNDLMIDLETLSTAHNAAIISIGACFFDMKTGVIGDTFYQRINIKDTPEFGHIDAETVKWWLNQSDEARQEITDPSIHAELPYVIQKFNDWLYVNRPPSAIWSNGSCFDLVVLRHAYQRCRYSFPWQFRQERDVRTIVDIAERISGTNASTAIKYEGTKHNAIADAIHQAKFVSLAYALTGTTE